MRRARKVLQSSAKDLARSLTYGFASFEHQVSGASAGVSAEEPDADGAIAEFVAAIQPMVADGSFTPDPGKGVTADHLAPLRDSDSRSSLLHEPATRFDLRSELTQLGIAATLDTALGGLDGRTVAIEGFDARAVDLVREISNLGGKVTTIGSSAGVATAPKGFIDQALAHAYEEFGPDLVANLGAEPADAWSIWGAEVDAIVPRTKMGIVSHTIADKIAADVVVPGAPLPITAKALAHLRRANKAAYPDFVSLAGPMFAHWPADGATTEAVRAEAVAGIGAVTAEIKDHEDGPLLAGCYRAEAFLGTWQESLPFGRPLAP